MTIGADFALVRRVLENYADGRRDALSALDRIRESLDAAEKDSDHYKAEMERSSKAHHETAQELERLREDLDLAARDLERTRVDRDEWRECSRDWRSRAERAEKVERVHRDALVRIEAMDKRRPGEVAGEALREASAVEAERDDS